MFCPDYVLPTWGVVTLLLSTSGLIGGLAFHLVENKGNVRWPHMVKGKSPVTHLGVLSDLIVGIAASNAIHLAISGLVSYEEARTESARFYLTFIALGVLSGFGGATLLRALSDKLRETISKTEFEGLQQRVEKETERREILEAGRLERIVEDSLLYRREPNDSDLALLEVKAGEVSEKTSAQQSPEDKLILAFKRSEEKDHRGAIALIEAALKSELPDSWRWPAYNLLGYSYHYDTDDNPASLKAAEENYLKALKVLADAPQTDATHYHQEAVTKTNLAYVYLDAGEPQRCLTLVNEVLALEQRFTSAMPLISSVALLAQATALALTQQPAQALLALQKITQPHQIGHLFTDGSISKAGRESLVAIANLPASFREFLK